jgi:uncharacterized membrane protein YkvA (DUF1232 family)
VQTRRQRLTTMLKSQAAELFTQFRIIRRAFVHPEVPWYAKVVCGCAVLYIASPIQLIPNFIPIIGQLDDVLLISLSIKLLKRSVLPVVLDECRNGSRLPAAPSSNLISTSSDLQPEGSRPGCQ